MKKVLSDCKNCEYFAKTTLFRRRSVFKSIMDIYPNPLYINLPILPT